MIGVGAAGGAVVRPRLDERFHHDQLMLGSTVVLAGALVVVGTSRVTWPIGVVMFLAGLAQLNLLSALVRFIPESGRKARRFGMLADQLFTGCTVDAVNLVLRDIAMDPLDIGAELAQHVARRL